jgi:hypothetical protein
MIDNDNTDNTSLSSFNSRENKKKLANNIHEYNDHYISMKLKIIGELLDDICKENKKNSEDKILLIKPFLSIKIPSISIVDYIERLSRYSGVSDELFVLILIYIDRICAMYKFNLNYYNIHKLIIASFVCSAKYHEDEYYSIDFYAKLGGVSKKEMINLEYVFLSLLQFNLFVKEEVFNKYTNSLLNLEISDDEDVVD